MKKTIYNFPKKPSPYYMREYFDVRLDKLIEKETIISSKRSGDLSSMLSRIHNHRMSLQLEE